MPEIIKKKTGLSTAGLVLGIIAVSLSFIPIINNFAVVLGVLALIFGVIGLIKKHGGKAIAAVVLGIVAIVITLSMQNAFSKAIDESFGVNSTNEDGSASIFADSVGLELDGETKLDLSGITSYGGFAKVTGTVINNSDITYNSPNISFIATDKEGNALDACSEYSSATLSPGQKWNFEATCGYNQDVTEVKLDKISHF